MTWLIQLILRLIALLAAYKLVIEQFEGWGVKDVYHLETEELLILIKAGAEIIVINEDSGDGTYLHKVKFLKHTFMQSTTKTISL
ncbi:MAG: hypothetical protein ACNFW9_03290 [Candidatus Kerfeldbacteria bacterium]